MGCVTVVLAGMAQEFKCPDDYGFYPHTTSCDKYWKCDNGVSEPKTCGNGLAFDASDPKYLTENCDYIHNVDCGDRTQLEPPIAATHCPRLYGIFSDDLKCDVFWNCWNGEASRYQCSRGWPMTASPGSACGPTRCPSARTKVSNVIFVANGFSCPAAGEIASAGGSFSRHAHPEDCRKYYICMEGVAREYGCPIGTVFKIGDSEGTGNCEDPEDVPGWCTYCALSLLFSFLFTCCLCGPDVPSLTPLAVVHSEDYYGDLDLKTIRKSELLAGLNTSGQSRAVPAPKAGGKPRPSSQNPRPAPQDAA
ncbi:hypothetical protein PR048_024025 [Dryococelus australis]|uniref:Chitin-binding type-2 domain-containing protein n=1 Tax=Dryococelus australis TaxID=614101 RepID=A0ABQ9GVR3_9NEOP|nr:hypothetical protein PR048_024025 [Dryococelus australis]